MNDLRFALRLLMKNPGFTLVFTLSMALGIGANTAVFSFVDSLLLRPLPVKSPQELVVITQGNSSRDVPTFSHPLFQDLRQQPGGLVDLLACAPLPVQQQATGLSSPLTVMLVSGNYFSLLGVRPLLGRDFTAEETSAPGTHPVALVSYGFWQSHFGGDTQVIGRHVSLNGLQHAIIGVAPPHFEGTIRGLAPDVYAPLMMQPQLSKTPSGAISYQALESRSHSWLLLMGRLKPGVNRPQAESALQIAGQQINRANGEAKAPPLALGDGRRGHDARIQHMTQPLLLLQLVMLLVWLVACVNGANLLLARATQRVHELAVRLAIGASRVRLMRQLLLETLVLAVLSGLAGILIAAWCSDFLGALEPRSADGPPALRAGLDPRVLLAAGLLTLLTGLLFGLLPAWHASRPQSLAMLRVGVASLTPRNSPWSLRNLLVVGQLALVLIVLNPAALCIQSLRQLQAIEVGFDVSQVLIMPIDLDRLGYRPEQSRPFYNQLTERLRGMPGVDKVSLAKYAPLGERGMWMYTEFQGYTPAPQERPLLRVNVISPDYFSTLGMPLVQGRDLNRADLEHGPRTAVVNESLVRRYFAGRDPIGLKLSLGSGPGHSGMSLEIVGVARDGRYGNLTRPTEPMVFMPQFEPFGAQQVVQIRTLGPASALAGAIRSATQELLPGSPFHNLQTLEQLKASAIYPARLAAGGLSVLGMLGLVLAAIGTYGVMAYWVGRRTREIGVRLALGAHPGDVVLMVLKQGAGKALAGVGLGLLGALGMTRLLASVLFGIQSFEPLILAAVVGVLLLVTLVACYLPARRASKIDPLIALRAE